MTQKIFRSILIVAITVLLLSLLFIVGVLYDYFGSAQKSRLNAELNLAAAGVEAGGAEYLEDLDAEDFRMTLISSDGDVIFDSETDPEAMENHSQREEIVEALETGFGESSRYSQTLMEQTFYYAKRLANNSVLRISTSRVCRTSREKGKGNWRRVSPFSRRVKAAKSSPRSVSEKSLLLAKP